MSANFYLSSHANNHMHPRAALLMARVDDLKHATELELAWVEIWSASSQSPDSLFSRGLFETLLSRLRRTPLCDRH